MPEIDSNYLYTLHNNAKWSYAMAIISLWYVCLLFYYVLRLFVQVILSCYNCLPTLPYPYFLFDHVHFPFSFIKKTFESSFSFYTIFSSCAFHSYIFFFIRRLFFIWIPSFHSYTLNSYTFNLYDFLILIIFICIIFIRILSICILFIGIRFFIWVLFIQILSIRMLLPFQLYIFYSHTFHSYAFFIRILLHLYTLFYLHAFHLYILKMFNSYTFHSHTFTFHSCNFKQ